VGMMEAVWVGELNSVGSSEVMGIFTTKEKALSWLNSKSYDPYFQPSIKQMELNKSYFDDLPEKVWSERDGK